MIHQSFLSSFRYCPVQVVAATLLLGVAAAAAAHVVVLTAIAVAAGAPCGVVLGLLSAPSLPEPVICLCGEGGWLLGETFGRHRGVPQSCRNMNKW